MTRPSPRQRALAFLLAALTIVVSCLGDPTGPSGRVGGLSLAPRFGNAMASAIVDVSAVRIQLNRPGLPEVVVDTVIVFPVDADTVELRLDVPLERSSEQFELRLAMTNAQGDTVFRAGPILVTAVSGNSGQRAEPEFIYVGTGADAAGVRFIDPPAAVPFGATVTLEAEAFDGQSNAIPGTPIGFELVSLADTVRARITNQRAGTFVAGSQRGDVQVRAVLASGQTATHTIAVQPVGNSIQRVSGNNQVGTVGQPLPAPLVARVVAADALGVEGTEVEWAVVVGVDTIATATSTSDVNGQVSYALTLSASAEEHEVHARIAGSATAFVIFSATAEAAVPAGLSFIVQPSNTQAAQVIAPAVQVAVLDAQGNVNTAATDVVTLGLLDSDGEGIPGLDGTTSVAAVAGIATFSDLSIDLQGVGYSLRASAASLVPDTSATFDVSAGPAVTLIITEQPPAGVVVGTPFFVEVAAEDAGGNRIQIAGAVTIALAANPGGATLGGTLSHTMDEHLVQFSDLTLDVVGTGYTLVASTAGLTSATTDAFAVTAPPNVNSWTNPAGGNWSLATNWSLGLVPSATDTVWIKLPGNYTVTVDVPTTAGRVEIGGTTGLQILDVASTLTLADTVVVESTAHLNLLNGGIIIGTGDARVAGHFGWSGGTLAGTGTIRVSGSMAITGVSPRTFTGRTIELSGLGLWSSTHTISSGLGATWRVLAGGNVDIQGDATWVYNQGGAAPVLDVQGSLLRTTSAGRVIVPGLSVSGALGVMTGALETRGVGTHSGSLAALAGATLAFGSGATHTMDAASFVSGEGTVDFLAGSQVTSQGGWNITGTMSMQGGVFVHDGASGSVGTLDLLAGRIGGTGMFFVNDQMTWTGGDLNGGNGTVRVVSDATLSMGGTAGRTLVAHTLSLHGSGLWSDTQVISSGLGGVIHVAPSGVLEIDGNPNWVYNQGGTQSVFDIEGTVMKTSTGSASVPGLTVSGTFAVDAGTLIANNVGVSSGSLQVAAGAMLQFASGTQNLSAGSLVAGAGHVQVAAGTVTVGGTWSVTGTTQLTGGIFAFNGTGSTATLLVDGGSRRGNGLLTVTDVGNWSAGSFDTNVGTTRFEAGSSFLITGLSARTLTAQVIEIGGTGTWTGNHTISSGIGARVRVLPGATLTVDADPQMVYNQGGALTRLEVEGTMLRTTSPGQATVAGLTVTGTVNVLTGVLAVNNDALSGGVFSVAAGAELRFLTGAQSLIPGSSVTGAGTVTIAGGSVAMLGMWSPATTQLTGGQFTHDAANGTTGTFDVLGGSYSGIGLFNVTGAMTWTAGTIAGGDGTVRVMPGATFASSGGTARSFTAHTIEIGGAGTWSDAHSWQSGLGAVLRVAPGATLDVQGTPSFLYNQGGVRPTLLNDGTVTRSGAGVAAIHAQWLNNGSLGVTGGSLELHGGGTMGGTVAVGAGATLSFAQNPFTLAHQFAASGAGDVLLSGGTLNSAAGDTATFARLRLNSGSLAHAGVVRGTQQVEWVGAASITGGGTTRIDPGAALDITTAVTRSLIGQATIENAGTTTWTGDAQLLTGQGARIVNVAGGSFDWAGNGSLVFNQGGAVPEFVNEGSFIRTGGLISGIGAFIVDTVGTEFRIDAGELQSVGGARFGGPGTKHTGGDFVVAGGTVSLQSGSAWSADGGQVRVSGGTVTVDSGGTVTMPDVALAAGSLAHEGRLDIVDAFTWTGGAITSNTVGLGGETHVGASANVSITGAAIKSLTGTHRFANAGTIIQFDGTGNISGGNGAVIDNAGTFEFNGTGQMLHNQGGSARFINGSGAVLQAGGTGVAVMGFPIENSGGVLSAQGAALRLTGGSVNSFFGNSVHTGGIPLELGGGVFTLTAPFNFGGDLTVTNASVDPGASVATVNGNLSVAAGGVVNITQAPAVFTVDGNATFAGSIGTMTAGRLDLAGDLTQVGAGTNFQPNGTHITRFTGAGHQVIAFATPGVFQNRFQHVEIFNSAPTDSVVLASGANAAGDLTVQTGRLGKVAPHRFVVQGNASVVPGPVGSGLRPFVLDVAGQLLNGTTSINPDTLVLNRPGTYTWTNVPTTPVHQRFNAATVTFAATSAPADLIASGTARLIFPAPNKAVLGNLVTENSGVIEQTVAGSDLSVNGDAIFGGGSTFGALTAGRLVVAGDFSQMAAGSASSFAPNGTHRTELGGTAPKLVSFANAAQSFFHRLHLPAIATRTVTLGTDVTVNDSLVMFGGGSQTTLVGAGTTQRLTVNGFVRLTQQTLSPRLAPPVLIMSQRPALDSIFSTVAGVFADTVVYTGAALTSLPLGRPLHYYSLRISTSTILAVNSANSFADSIRGDLSITTGGLSINSTGFGMLVTGDLQTTGTGVLRMQTAFQGLTVNGSARFLGGSTAGLLTNGILKVLGGFEQGGPNGASFQASGSHSVEFAGSTIQSVIFASPDTVAGTSRFAAMNLYRQNARSRVNLLSDVYALALNDTSAGFADSVITAGPARLITSTANLSNTVFSRAPLVLTSGNGFLGLSVVRFEAMDPTTRYLTFTRFDGFGSTSFNNITFAGPVPTTGYYLHFITPGTIQAATVGFTASSPAAPLSGRYLKSGAGATSSNLLWNGTPLP